MGNEYTATATVVGHERPLDDLREQIVDHAADALRAQGSAVELPDGLLREAIASAGIPAATAYRALRDETFTPQQLLHREVLRRLFRRDRGFMNYAATEEAVSGEIIRQRENLESSELVVRSRAVRSVIRVGTNAAVTSVVTMKERSLLIAAFGAVRSRGDAAQAWEIEALSEGERSALREYGRLYATLATFFQCQIRSPFTMDQFATAALAAMEGTAMRYEVSEHVEGIDRSCELGDGPEYWTQFGVMFHALLMVYFEPIDPDNPFVDLTLTLI